MSREAAMRQGDSDTDVVTRSMGMVTGVGLGGTGGDAGTWGRNGVTGRRRQQGRVTGEG